MAALLFFLPIIIGCSKKSPVNRTDDLVSFWNNELQETIHDGLALGKLPYPEIAERFKETNLEILRQTKKAIHIDCSTSYNWADKRVEGTAGMIESNNMACITLHIPAIRDTFDMLQKSRDLHWEEAFKSHQIILVMHESEHLRAGDTKPTHIDMSEESRAWDDTCRYTIAPLAEKYHVPLFSSDAVIYRAWKEAGGDTNSFYWLEAMKKRYGEFDGRTRTRP